MVIPVNEATRIRQQRYRKKRKEAGFHRLEVWIPADVMAALDKRHKPYGEFCCPQWAVIALLRRAMRLPRPLEPWERYRNNPVP